MASALAYGWGGWFWQTAVKSDEQFGDMFVGDEVESALPRVASALYGWDMKRLFFWSLILAVFCIIAFCFNPDETSFRTYLNEQSFRKHLQGLHEDTGLVSNASTKDTNGHAAEDQAKTKASSSSASSSVSFSGGNNLVTPTPFRFSNHIAVSLRTPQYHFLHSYLFSVVWILPGSAYAGTKKSNHVTKPNSTGLNKTTSSTFGIDGEDHGEGYDPTLQGVWYFGAFGRWWNMGRIMDDPAIRPWNRKKKELAAAGELGKREPGLISVVALPKDDRSPESKTAPSTPLRRSSANVPSARAESPPPLRADASLPLHTRALAESSFPNKAMPVTAHLAVPPTKDSQSDSTVSAKPIENKKDSPMLADLSSSLAAAQANVTDLREQLNAFNSTVANSQAQLQSSVTELRRKKKDEDTDRADLKVKMKHLEENKRQAESARREAEKKLKTAVTLRDAVRERCDTMQREMSRMQGEIQEYEEQIKGSKMTTESYTKSTGEAVGRKEEELSSLDKELAYEVSLNADLAAKVMQAAETLQALIDNSPEAVVEQTNGPTPPSGEQVLHHNVGPPSHTSGNRPYAPLHNYSDPYQTSGLGQHTPSHSYQHNISGHSQDFRPYSATNNVFRRTASGNVSSIGMAEPYRRSSPFFDMPGYEGFGPLGVPVQAYEDGNTGRYLEPDEPGSPNVNMSSSFTANLLPQGLFRSLEGDQTPQETSVELDDPMDVYELDPASLELPISPEKDDEVTGQTPKAASPGSGSQGPVSNGHGSKECEDDPVALQGSLDEASRKLAEYHDEHDGPRPRRWFSASKSKTHAEGLAGESGVPPHLNEYFGMPLTHTISNESMLVPGGGFDNNPFAPSAAEKRALRWGSIGKWAGGARQISAPHEAGGGPYKPNLDSVPNSARASSVDLNIQQNARAAWEHAGPSAISSMIGAVPQEKRSFKLWSLGKKSAKEEPGSGSSIWN